MNTFMLILAFLGCFGFALLGLYGAYRLVVNIIHTITWGKFQCIEYDNIFFYVIGLVICLGFSFLTGLGSYSIFMEI